MGRHKKCSATNNYPSVAEFFGIRQNNNNNNNNNNSNNDHNTSSATANATLPNTMQHLPAHSPTSASQASSGLLNVSTSTLPPSSSHTQQAQTQQLASSIPFQLPAVSNEESDDDLDHLTDNPLDEDVFLALSNHKQLSLEQQKLVSLARQENADKKLADRHEYSKMLQSMSSFELENNAIGESSRDTYLRFKSSVVHRGI